jgi:Mg-chelatase subunit ChlI
MKTIQVATRLISLASLAALALTGCSKPEHQDLKARVKDAYEDAKNAVADTWKDVKAYGFEKRREFSDNAKSLKSKIDDEAKEVRANYIEAKASASRKAAMEELKSAQADYKEKVDALEHATADTWASAKQKVISAWDRLEAAVKKARED